MKELTQDQLKYYTNWITQLITLCADLSVKVDAAKQNGYTNRRIDELGRWATCFDGDVPTPLTLSEVTEIAKRSYVEVSNMEKLAACCQQLNHILDIIRYRSAPEPDEGWVLPKEEV